MENIKEVSSSAYGRIRVATNGNKEMLYNLKDLCKLFNIKFQKVREELPSSIVYEIDFKVNVRTSKQVFIKSSGLETCLRLSEEANADEIYDWLLDAKLKTKVFVGEYTIDDLKDHDTAFKFLNRYIDLETKNSILEHKIEENMLKVEFANSVYGTRAVVDLGLINFKIKYKNMSLANILEYLRADGILDENNQPLQKYIDEGYFRLVTAITYKGTEEIRLTKVLVYKKGIRLIEKTIDKTGGKKM